MIDVPYNGAVLSMTNASISRAKGVGWTNSVAMVCGKGYWWCSTPGQSKTWQMKAQFCDERTYLNAGKETFH